MRVAATVSRFSVTPCLAVAVAAAAVLLLFPAIVRASYVHGPHTAPWSFSIEDFSRLVSERLEKQRLQAHFLQVEAELRRRDVSHLSAAQRATRQRLIAWGGEYRAGGEFPRNEYFPGQRVPIFRDAHGTLCAMAYLIDRSGRADIVDKVAARRNLAYIPELADDPALVAWLSENGLMLDEAARIQPTYEGEGVSVGEDPGRERY